LIDIHTHVLPGVDDGPEDVEEAVRTINGLVSGGADTIVATPHNLPGRFEPPLDLILRSRQALSDALVSAESRVRLLLGHEITFQPELLDKLEREEFLTINGTSYFLFELPPFNVPPGLRDFVFRARLKGYYPVLAHPERNEMLRFDLDFLAKLVEGGTLVQLTAGSITGKLGPNAQDSSKQILQSGLAHVIASDCHSLRFGPGDMAEAAEVAAAFIGSEAAAKLVEDNPLAIVEGRPLYQ